MRKPFWAKSFEHHAVGYHVPFAKKVWEYYQHDRVIGFIERSLLDGREIGRYFGYVQAYGQPAFQFDDYAHISSAKRGVERAVKGRKKK